MSSKEPWETGAWTPRQLVATAWEVSRRRAVSATHVANLLKEIWDSDALCAERPWRASHLVMTWWKSALEADAAEDAHDSGGKKTARSKRV